MSESVLLEQMVPQKTLKEIDHWVAKYPDDKKESAVMYALLAVQEVAGHITEAGMNAVAEYLDMQPADVYEVVSFYSMYHTKPKGRHLISVCTNITCQLRGSKEIVSALEKKLGVSTGETTEDGRFTLCSVECLGACVNAPMMQIDKKYHEHLTVDALDSVLAEYS